MKKPYDVATWSDDLLKTAYDHPFASDKLRLDVIWELAYRGLKKLDPFDYISLLKEEEAIERLAASGRISVDEGFSYLETTSSIDKKERRKELRCSYCPPNRGENAKRKPRHGAKKKRKARRK